MSITVLCCVADDVLEYEVRVAVSERRVGHEVCCAPLERIELVVCRRQALLPLLHKIIISAYLFLGILRQRHSGCICCSDFFKRVDLPVTLGNGFKYGVDIRGVSVARRGRQKVVFGILGISVAAKNCELPHDFCHLPVVEFFSNCDHPVLQSLIFSLNLRVALVTLLLTRVVPIGLDLLDEKHFTAVGAGEVLHARVSEHAIAPPMYIHRLIVVLTATHLVEQLAVILAAVERILAPPGLRRIVEPRIGRGYAKRLQ